MSGHASAAPRGAYLERLFGLTGRTAVVVGGTGVLGGAIAEESFQVCAPRSC